MRHDAIGVADTPQDEHPRTTFLRSLNVKRNATAGITLGAILATAVYIRFVYLIDRPHSPVLWLMLAFVLAVGIGFLLTVTFTVGAAYRATRRSNAGRETPPDNTESPNCEDDGNTDGPGLGDAKSRH